MTDKERHAAYMREWNQRQREKMAALKEAGVQEYRDCNSCTTPTLVYELVSPHFLMCRACAAKRAEKWRNANRDKARLVGRRSARKRTVQRKIEMRRWKEKNRQRHIELNRAFLRRNPDKAKALSAKSRARRTRHEYEARGHATSAQIAARIAYFGWKCWVCGVPYEAVDHVKPVARGGSNWPANLRPICRVCNGRKGAQWPFAA